MQLPAQRDWDRQRIAYGVRRASNEAEAVDIAKARLEDARRAADTAEEAGAPAHELDALEREVEREDDALRAAEDAFHAACRRHEAEWAERNPYPA